EVEEEEALGTRPGLADHRRAGGGDARMAKKKAKKTKKKQVVQGQRWGVAASHRALIHPDPASRSGARHRRPVPGTVTQALLVTLPAFTQRVQTRSRLGTPPTTVRTETRFGSHRRLVTLCAWLIRLPTAGCFPQTAQRWAMTVLLSLVAGRGLPL